MTTYRPVERGAGPSGGAWLGLVLIAVLSLAHQRLLGDWVVEDAAISFSYARNLVNGHGLVAFPGAEPVEGYSNPTWVALLALLFVSGADLFDLARGLGLLTGGAAVVLAGLLAHRLHRPGAGADRAALLAAGLLAGSSHHAIWSASGLENPLFVLLLLAGGWALAAGRPVAAGLLFALLGMTRPEGAMYGLVAGGWLVLIARRQLLPWTLAFVLPLLLFEGARLWYFAWPLPNTYYAKAGVQPFFDRFAPGSDGLVYLGRHLVEGSLPGLLAVACVGVFGRGPRLLLLAWGGAAVFFCVWSGGDWMKGGRWISFLVPLLCVAGGLGLSRLVPTRWPRSGLALALALVLAWAVPQVGATLDYAEAPETSPASIKARLRHVREIEDDLLLERTTYLDIDMGAITTWSGMKIVDYGRLLDVPMAHHRYRRDVVEEHLSGWHRLDLAHLHGRWARRTGFVGQSWWSRSMVEVEGYPLDVPRSKRHAGIWVRRDHLSPTAWRRTHAELLTLSPAGSGLVWVGAQVWSEEVAPGESVLVDLILGRIGAVEGPQVMEVQLLDAAEQVAETWRVQAGRAWYPADRWAVGETVRTRAVFPIGRDRPPGRYRLRVGGGDSPWVEAGELRVVDAARSSALLDAARSALDALAAAGQCEAAIEGWEALRLRTPRDRAATRTSRRRLSAAVGACLRASVLADPTRAPVHLPLLVQWDADHPGTRALVEAHGRSWWRDAEAARRAGNEAEATRLYDRILRVDPTRTWARRRKEELRADRPAGGA